MGQEAVHSRMIPPSLGPNLLERTRLYTLLDQTDGDQPLWLWGPPGCGKSMLVASYLRARGLKSLWYPVTDNDRDPYALLSALSTVLEKTAVKVNPNHSLSSLTVVLDDYHRAHNTLHPLAELILQAGAGVILISRSDPPDRLRQQLKKSLVRIGWQRLRLTRSEARQMAKNGQTRPNMALVDAMHAASGGWVAGFCLLLRDGIHPDHAEQTLNDGLERSFSSAHHLPPLSRPGLGDSSPWRVAVHTLRSFEIHTVTGPIRHYRKEPKRPIDLLKRLIAVGAHGEAEAAVIDSLWPEAEGDFGVRALSTTLHRLRALLGYPKAVLREGGWLRLDPGKVWVDAWALEATLDDIESQQAGQATPTLPSQLGPLARALRLYRSPLLSGDTSTPWLLAPRNHLHARVVHHLKELGAHHEERQAWAEAEALYRQGLATDNCSEPLAQGYLRTLAAQGRWVELDAAYGNLEQSIRATTGGTPSQQTQTLFAQLKRTITA